MQADKSHYVDMDTFKFVTAPERVKPFNVDVPWYLWAKQSSRQHYIPHPELNSSSILSMVHKFDLKDMTIHFKRTYRDASMMFWDKIKHCLVDLSIQCGPCLINQGTQFTNITGVDYHILVDYVGSAYHTEIPIQGRPFSLVSDLSHNAIPNYGGNEFCMGLRPNPYEVRYKGRVLNGESLALLCGVWAVLLDDDLSFDTLVLLEGVDYDRLFVSAFPYTTNPYILKVKTLIG